MHAHASRPATEVRPTVVTAQRSAHCGALRLHTGDAWALVQFAVLRRVDVVNDHRARRPRVHAGYAVLWIDQRDTDTVGARNRLCSELRHVPEKVDHTTAFGHYPGHAT